MAALLGIDLGGTKLALALFTFQGELISRKAVKLDGRAGSEVGLLISDELQELLACPRQEHYPVKSIGISVPGISRSKEGTVWAPNIPGWEDYPLLKEVQAVAGDVPVTIESDRSCYILGEQWQGAARGTRDAIFLAVGTGIGAGISINGNILQGAQGIAGAIGWMGLSTTFEESYTHYGCFEYHASGNGIARMAQKRLAEHPSYTGPLAAKAAGDITAPDVFAAYEIEDPIATEVIHQCIKYWGVAIANLVSLFNPEKVIVGGGVFGPAIKFLPAIKEEALRWAQPISMGQVSIEPSALGAEAGLYGAGLLALRNVKTA